MAYSNPAVDEKQKKKEKVEFM